MNQDRDWSLWHDYKESWKRADKLQERCEQTHLRFGVIFKQGQWFVHCIDTTDWITEKFFGGHRKYPRVIWSEI